MASTAVDVGRSASPTKRPLAPGRITSLEVGDSPKGTIMTITLPPGSDARPGTTDVAGLCQQQQKMSASVPAASGYRSLPASRIQAGLAMAPAPMWASLPMRSQPLLAQATSKQGNEQSLGREGGPPLHKPPSVSAVLQPSGNKTPPAAALLQSRAAAPVAAPPTVSLLQEKPRGEQQSQAAALPWSVEHTFRLGFNASELVARGEVRVLDRQSIFSVSQAVHSLNAGTIACPEDVCIVFSTSQQANFVLYRRGSKDKILELFGLTEVKPNEVELTASVPSVTRVAEIGHDHKQEATSSTWRPLQVGTITNFGDISLQVLDHLGMGSFGAVWRAKNVCTGREVAVKEIVCQSEVELTNASYEGELLEKLSKRRNTAASTASLSGLDRIPAYVASATYLLGPDQWRVRLAMTKVEGVALDQFLHVSRTSMRDIHRPAERFKEACCFASQLLSQLLPTLESIAEVAFHRDINSHNVLVSGSLMEPCFGLVDFGLAVDLDSWRGPRGPLSWHLVDIGGDCRYWPVSAWMQFECGWEELAKYPSLAVEYQTQLDRHALGITAMQVLAEMMGAGDPVEPTVEGILPSQVSALLSAWSTYWQDATIYWKRLLETFRSGGDQDALKVSCINEGVHNVIGADLSALRSALRKAADACHQDQSEAVRSAEPFFRDLRALVSVGAPLQATGPSIPVFREDAAMDVGMMVSAEVLLRQARPCAPPQTLVSRLDQGSRATASATRPLSPGRIVNNELLQEPASPVSPQGSVGVDGLEGGTKRPLAANRVFAALPPTQIVRGVPPTAGPLLQHVPAASLVAPTATGIRTSAHLGSRPTEPLVTAPPLRQVAGGPLFSLASSRVQRGSSSPKTRVQTTGSSSPMRAAVIRVG